MGDERERRDKEEQDSSSVLTVAIHLSCDAHEPEEACGLEEADLVLEAALLDVRTHHDEVEGNGCDDIDEEPAFKVVKGDLAGVRDYLVVLVDVGGAEIDEYVDDEHDVDHEVDYCHGPEVEGERPI